jgi:hypothetical protein
MGLTDTPGGAAYSGFYALIFGLGFLFTKRDPVLKTISLASALLGITCIALTQVRVFLGLSGVFLLGLAFVFARQAQHARLLRMLVVGGGVFAAALLWALTIGGEDIRERLGTFLQGTPFTTVYAETRGQFLKQTLQELKIYPWGAGLGRWGMVSYYAKATSKSLWVEIQWTGWLYDGGIPLILAYSATLLVALFTALKVALTRRLRDAREIRLWGALFFAYNLGIIAATFVFPPFMGQVGTEFWLFNAGLYSVYQSHLIKRHRVKAGLW